jgi:hypothetical protein
MVLMLDVTGYSPISRAYGQSFTAWNLGLVLLLRLELDADLAKRESIRVAYPLSRTVPRKVMRRMSLKRAMGVPGLRDARSN